MRVRRFATFALAALVAGATAPATAATVTTAPWIAVSDLHFGPRFGGDKPSSFGNDTNPALLTSLLAELRRLDPDPPVVMITGDFLAHENDPHVAAQTFALVAREFDHTFPHAQFLVALGNNDSACGDYQAPEGGAFLAAVAKAWQPLVDRHGAAPNFVRSFSRDGSYVATLPIPNVRAVVINDVSFALRFNNACATGKNAPGDTLHDLDVDTKSANPHSKNWVLLHIPPGIDAYSTSYLAHRLAIVPFMRPHVREALDGMIGDPKNHIALVVAGHTHKFAYRVASGPARVPMLLVPSVSPIFGNAPSFLELDVARDATVKRVREYSYLDGAWNSLGGWESLGLETFDAAGLLTLQMHLEHDREARAHFDRLYEGGANPEINESNWRTYWCAATAFSSSAFGECDLHEGFSILTPRGLKLFGSAAAVAIVIVVAGIMAIVRRRKRRLPT